MESYGATAPLEEIAPIDGAPWLYIEPADLGLALFGEPPGHVASVYDGRHPYAQEMKTAFKQVVAACRNAEIIVGLPCGSGKAAVIAAQHGFAARRYPPKSGRLVPGWPTGSAPHAPAEREVKLPDLASLGVHGGLPPHPPRRGSNK